MSELTRRLRQMLTQAQGFARDAPMEALARAQNLVSEAHSALAVASDAEREEVLDLLTLGKKYVEKYERAHAKFQQDNTDRAALFLKHERERLQRPIASKDV